VILAGAIALKMPYGTGTRVFKRYVCNPVPKSVKDIKVSRASWLLASGHRYGMHFKISKDDMTLILNSKRFKEVTDFTYRGGTLSWDIDPSHGEAVGLYIGTQGQVAPDWFRPDEWPNPKCYRLKERNIRYRLHIQVVIYNEDVGEAYLLEYLEGF
jgi:hypothetical protein